MSDIIDKSWFEFVDKPVEGKMAYTDRQFWVYINGQWQKVRAATEEEKTDLEKAFMEYNND